MRTCLSGCAKIAPQELQLADFATGGAKWAFLNACERGGLTRFARFRRLLCRRANEAGAVDGAGEGRASCARTASAAVGGPLCNGEREGRGAAARGIAAGVLGQGAACLGRSPHRLQNLNPALAGHHRPYIHPPCLHTIHSFFCIHARPLPNRHMCSVWLHTQSHACGHRADCLYNEGLLERAVELAGKAGVSVAFDLASFEVVRAFRPQITSLLESGAVACCFCNEVGRGRERGRGWWIQSGVECTAARAASCRACQRHAWRTSSPAPLPPPPVCFRGSHGRGSHL